MASTNPDAPNGGPGDSRVLHGEHTYGSVTDKISSLVLTRPYTKGWLLGFAFGFSLLTVLMTAVTVLFMKGIGIWESAHAGDVGVRHHQLRLVGRHRPRGHPDLGDLAPAQARLANVDQPLRRGDDPVRRRLRGADAGLRIHLGRPWVFYWLTPYPNTMGMWPNWRSPLVWDVFAVSTYATVSLLFWYVGLIPDLATLRDRSKNKLAKYIYGMMAMGWRGSARHWNRYQTAYLLLAGLATPLVVSVHTVVSFDFTIGIVPGWHSTIFPPYFVAGAIYSGFAMVLTLAIPLRARFKLHDFITMRHLENMAKVMLATGLIVTYGYALEAFNAWYGDNIYEQYLVLKERPFGDYAHTYALLILCNCVSIQIFWLKWARTNIYVLFLISLIVNWGMWLERYVIIVISLHSDYMPSAWDMFHGTIWDYATLVGTMGLFLTLLFLFLRFLPVISIAEMQELVSETRGPAAPGERP